MCTGDYSTAFQAVVTCMEYYSNAVQAIVTDLEDYSMAFNMFKTVVTFREIIVWPIWPLYCVWQIALSF